MSPSENNDHDNDTEYPTSEEFGELMQQWGVEIPHEVEYPEASTKGSEEKTGPLIITLEGWATDKFQRPLNAMKALSGRNTRREAAAALFAYTWTIMLQCEALWEEGGLDREPIRHRNSMMELLEHIEDKDSNIIRIYEALAQGRAVLCEDLVELRDEFYIGDIEYGSGVRERKDRANVEVMVGAAQVILLADPEGEFSPELVEVLDRVYPFVARNEVSAAEMYDHRLFHWGPKDLSGDVVGFIACWACAIICHSYAHMMMKLRADHESAFFAFIEAMSFFNKSHYNIDQDPLPYSYEGFSWSGNSNKIDRIIEAWEKAKARHSSTTDWQRAYKALLELEDAMYDEGLDGEGFGIEGSYQPGFVYFPVQLEFCKGQMTQDQARYLIEELRNNTHRERMRLDFFGESWQFLEEESQQHLLSAEIEWYEASKRGGSDKSAVFHYSMALETELHAIVFSNPNVQTCVREVIRNQKANPKYRAMTKLTGKDAKTLNLGNMGKVLRLIEEYRNGQQGNLEGLGPGVGPIVKFIASLPAEQELLRGLSNPDFTEFIDELWKARGVKVHRLRDTELLANVGRIRRNLLGIGTRGYLADLAQMKQKIEQFR